MKAEHLNVFFNSTINVFKEVMNINIERNKLGLTKSHKDGEFLGVLLTISGDLKGYVYFTFPRKTLENSTTNLFPDVTPETGFISHRDLMVSAMTEIVTIASENALASISIMENLECSISIAKLYTHHIDLVIKRDRTLSLPFVSEIGLFEMNISLIDTKRFFGKTKKNISA